MVKILIQQQLTNPIPFPFYTLGTQPGCHAKLSTQSCILIILSLIGELVTPLTACWRNHGCSDCDLQWKHPRSTCCWLHEKGASRSPNFTRLPLHSAFCYLKGFLLLLSVSWMTAPAKRDLVRVSTIGFWFDHLLRMKCDIFSLAFVSTVLLFF